MCGEAQTASDLDHLDVLWIETVDAPPQVEILIDQCLQAPRISGEQCFAPEPREVSDATDRINDLTLTALIAASNVVVKDFRALGQVLLVCNENRRQAKPGQASRIVRVRVYP